ncbi:MAG: TetR/AcrR family transcriptional regulator [Streptococcaceae bacterium]|jgi:AcrR family transcriptional regulator|nr:TetR/AcrR family transcriptional regulator [Streptococcaceae bacterium]
MNQSEKKRARVLEVTEEMLQQYTISDITMDEIAQKAEVSKVTIFKYFESKDKLMNRVLHGTLTEMIDDITEIMESELGYEELYQALTALKLSRLDRMTPLLTQNIMTQYATNPDFFDMGSRDLQRQLAKKLFEKGRAEGKINSQYTDEELQMLLDVYDEGMKVVAPDFLLSHTDALTKMFLNALK